MRSVLYALLAGAAALGATGASAQTVLKASHQFPGGKGDPRDEMVQIIAKEAKAANVGLEIQVYPGASLFKPNDQWNAHGQRPARHLRLSRSTTPAARCAPSAPR